MGKGDPGRDAVAEPGRHTSARGGLWLLAVVGPLAAFAALALAAEDADAFAWDGPIVDVLDAIAPVSSSDVHVDPVLTTVTIGVGALTAAIVVALLVSRQLRMAVFLVAAIGGSVLLSSITKVVVQRPAIEGDPSDYTFPSGTATWSLATAVALTLAARTPRDRRVAALAGTALVLGFGAVIAWEEWHHPSDVIAGWCLACSWVVAVWLGVRPRASRAGEKQ